MKCDDCFALRCHFHPNNNYWKEDPVVIDGCKDYEMINQQLLKQQAGERR